MSVKSILTAFALALSACLLPACTAARVSSDSPEFRKMEADADIARREFINADPGMRDWFDDSYGYAIFPVVSKGAVGVGGAGGDGLVFRQGKAVGTTNLSQGTVGLQLGGQTYREVIFLEDARAFRNFTSGGAELSAQASAVAVTAGASADADFDGGMAVFTIAIGGLMFEASVGGQGFDYEPLD